MEKGAVKLVVFNGEDFGYWKYRTHNYFWSQGRAIWEIIPEAYIIPTTLENATTAELMKYGNNYKALNLITTILGRNVYDRISHLESALTIWEKLWNTLRVHLRLSQPIRTLTTDSTKTFSQKPDESLDDCFARFESIMSSLCCCGLLACDDNEHAK
jgi:hypothetical protein